MLYKLPGKPKEVRGHGTVDNITQLMFCGGQMPTVYILIYNCCHFDNFVSLEKNLNLTFKTMLMKT